MNFSVPSSLEMPFKLLTLKPPPKQQNIIFYCWVWYSCKGIHFVRQCSVTADLRMCLSKTLMQSNSAHINCSNVHCQIRNTNFCKHNFCFQDLTENTTGPAASHFAEERSSRPSTSKQSCWDTIQTCRPSRFKTTTCRPMSSSLSATTDTLVGAVWLWVILFFKDD